jgi:ribosomal protein L21E
MPVIDNPGLATTSVNGPAAGGASAVSDLVARINDGSSIRTSTLLSRALRVRWEAVEAAKVVRAMASLQLGDSVRIRDEVKTRRHRGLIGKVVERHDDAVVICLGRQVADADHRHIRCSPVAVDKLPAAPQ